MSNATTSTPEPAAQSSQSVFVQHLATYPALTAVAGLVAANPIAKMFASNAIPLLQYLTSVSEPVTKPIAETAAPAIRRADQFGDRILTGVDHRFPSLRTAQPEDIKQSIVQPISGAAATARDQYQTRVAQPITNAAVSARDQYNKVYDNQTTAITHGINDRIAPLNDRAEALLNSYLPPSPDAASKLDEAAVEKDDSQVNRSYRIAQEAVARAVPVAFTLRDQAKQHVVETYSRNVEEATGGTGEEGKPGLLKSVAAAAVTGRQLARESINKACDKIHGRNKTE